MTAAPDRIFATFASRPIFPSRYRSGPGGTTNTRFSLWRAARTLPDEVAPVIAAETTMSLARSRVMRETVAQR
jgi:hypothetical protein